MTLGCSPKSFALDVPGLVALGAEEFLRWFRQAFAESDEVASPPRAIWDEIFAEAAILVNFDTKCLIFGFRQWIPDAYRYNDIPEEICDFIEVPDLARFFMKRIRERWPGWQVQLALPAEFATQETVVLCANLLVRPLIIEVRDAPETGWEESQMREAFNRGFELSAFSPRRFDSEG